VSSRLQSGPTTLYAQLANIMRGRITSGEWPDGTNIPTLQELCEQYHVARVTARQATQDLVQEGLLSSKRGTRTYVTYTEPEASAEGGKALLSPIGDVNAGIKNLQIDILAERLVDHLPVGWKTDREQGEYMLIEKVSRDGAVPFAYSECYIARHVFDAFPKGGERRKILAQLVRDHADPPAVGGSEKMRVAAADYQEAMHLGCAMSSPIARIRRVFWDRNNHAIYLVQTAYRADRFEIEHDLATYLTASDAGAAKPRTAAKKRDTPVPVKRDRRVGQVG
jgi:GntR family transcriptional regulator